MIFSLAALMACGGTSGPASTLNVSPASLTVVAGDPPTVFTASPSNPTGAVSWSLTGDGSLSVAANFTAIYTPPASVAATETATLTAAAIGASARITITIKPAPSPRTVSGTLQTVFSKDDGNTNFVTVVPGWSAEMQGATVTALLVPDSSAAGYTSFPVTVAADNTFSVPNVPARGYFIQIDKTIKFGNAAAIVRTLYPQSADTPNLTVVVSGRADRTISGDPTSPLHLDVTGLTALIDPAAVRFPVQQLVLADAHASLFARTPVTFTPPLQPGATSLDTSFRYGAGIFLPDASKGDVTYLYERDERELGTGAAKASYFFASNYLRSTTLTIADTTGGTLSGAMLPVPETGSVHYNFAMSQFAALASAVHPSALTSATANQTLTVFSLMHSAPPVEVVPPATPLAVLNMPPQSTADIDYGTMTYGRLPENTWTDFVKFVYTYDVTLPDPSGGTAFPTSETYVKQAYVSAAPASFAPSLSPPRLPRLDGKDALQAQANTGLTPVVSWSPPATGGLGSYTLEISLIDASPATKDGDLASLTVAGLLGTTSFKIPPGNLKAGRPYVGRISALGGTAAPAPRTAEIPAPQPVLQNNLVTEIATVDFGIFTP